MAQRLIDRGLFPGDVTLDLEQRCFVFAVCPHIVVDVEEAASERCWVLADALGGGGWRPHSTETLVWSER